MGRFLHLKLPNFFRRKTLMLLAFCWVLGLLLGSVLSAAAGGSIVSLMRTAVISRVSITGLLTAILLPFLLSAFAVFIQEQWLLLPVCFGKAFLVSFTGFGVLAAYGSAGWLIRWLLMFSDCCSLPLLFWYWLRNVSGQRRNVAPVTLLVLLAAVAISSFDYCVVSPFLATVIS